MSEDDKVAIPLPIPPPPEELAEQEQEDMESAFTGEKPKITASLWTGRTFPEMYENKEDNILVLANGYKGHVDLSLNSKVFAAMKESLPEGMQATIRRLMEKEPVGGGPPDFFNLMGALTKLRFVEEVRYRTIDEIADAAQ